VVEVPASLARMNERWTNRGWKNHERKRRTSKQKNGGGNMRKTNTLRNETKQQDRMHTWPAEHLEEWKKR
jgi:hypothetical protein